MPPASWPSSCSREGSLARRVTSARGQVGALEQAALDRERVGVLARRTSSSTFAATAGSPLTHARPVGPVEVGQQRLAAGVAGGAARERVLDDRVLGLGRRAARVAQLRHLLHGQAAEVGREDGVRGREALGELRDRLGLLVLGLSGSPPSCLRPRGRAGARGARRDAAVSSPTSHGSPRAGGLRRPVPPPWVFGRVVSAVRALGGGLLEDVGRGWCGWCRPGCPGPSSGRW